MFNTQEGFYVHPDGSLRFGVARLHDQDMKRNIKRKRYFVEGMKAPLNNDMYILPILVPYNDD